MSLSLFNPTWTVGWANISPHPGMIICCALRDVPMNSKLLEFFTYHPNLPLNALRKLIANDKNQEIFSIEKQQKRFFSNVLEMKPQILFQNWMRIFWGIADFCRSKNKDFRKFACTRDFLAIPLVAKICNPWDWSRTKMRACELYCPMEVSCGHLMAPGGGG